MENKDKESSGPKIIIMSESPSLEQAQELVGGRVERILLPDGRRMLVDEEGAFPKGLDINLTASVLADQPIVGDAIILDEGVGENEW